jgi:Spy/CpxP family protein refolding chaperone
MERRGILTAVIIVWVSGAFAATAAAGDIAGIFGGKRGVRVGRAGGMLSAARAPEIDTDRLRELLTFANELNLTERQRDTIRQIRSDAIREAAQCNESVAESQKELKELLDREEPDFSAAHAKNREVAELSVQIQALPVNAYEKAYLLLSDEQKHVFSDIKKKLNAKPPYPAPADEIGG